MHYNTLYYMLEFKYRPNERRRCGYEFLNKFKLKHLFVCFIFMYVGLIFINTSVEVNTPVKVSSTISDEMDETKLKVHKNTSLEGDGAARLKSTSPKREGYVYICITGQLSRLELDTKIQNVIRPISARYSDVIVTLSLFTETNYFVNKDKSSDLISPYSIQTVRSMLIENGATTVNVYSVEHNTDIPINQNVINGFDKLYLTPDLKKKRAYGHIRQYEALYNCKHALQHVEKVPEFIIRLRDDIYVKSFDIDSIVKELHYNPLHSRRTIITPTCASWFGLNDKIAIVSGEYANIYFKSPLETYQRPMIEKWVINPETYYLSTFLNQRFFIFVSSSLEVVPTTIRNLNNCTVFVPRGVAACEKQIVASIPSRELQCASMASSCQKQIHSDETLWIVMTTWNDTPNFKKAVQSIQTQMIAFSNVRHVVFEDFSNDTINREDFSSIIFIDSESDVQSGAAYGKWRLFEYVKHHSSPNDYVIVLDGDDVLSDENVFRYIRRELHWHKPWFAWGKINGKYSEQCGPLIGTTHNVRSAKWSICHPRLFSAHLLKSLKKDEFQRDDGEWLAKATDRPFIFSFMEQAGDDRILFLDERPIYNYTWTPNNGLLVYNSQVITGDKRLVNSRPRKQMQLTPIILIICMWKGRGDSNLFNALMKSEIPTGQILDIHICNNDPSQQEQRAFLAKNIAETNKHKITIHDMGDNTYGYGRFLLARKLLQLKYMDYVIMLDDDQYVFPETIYSVYENREPMTYKTWFGKNWDLSSSKTNYWHPKETVCVKCPLREWRLRLPKVDTWQYGGTGMSIIDANAFKIKELYELETKYHRLEDMWLSYIVQLANFKIGRLRVEFKVQKLLSAAGQFQALMSLKQEFFEHIGKLRCNKREHRKMSISRPIPYENHEFVFNDFDFGPNCDPKCATFDMGRVCWFHICFKCNFCYKSRASCTTYTCPYLYEPKERNELIKCARSTCTKELDNDRCCQVII